MELEPVRLYETTKANERLHTLNRLYYVRAIFKISKTNKCRLSELNYQKIPNAHEVGLIHIINKIHGFTNLTNLVCADKRYMQN